MSVFGGGVIILDSACSTRKQQKKQKRQEKEKEEQKLEAKKKLGYRWGNRHETGKPSESLAATSAPEHMPERRPDG
jgi:hypothetical protein